MRKDPLIRKITPEEIIKLVSVEPNTMSIDDAIEVLSLLKKLAKIVVVKYLDDEKTKRTNSRSICSGEY